MAYFGDSVTRRPWPRADVRFVLLFVLSFAGIAGSIYVAKDLPMFKAPPPQPVAAAVAASPDSKPASPEMVTVLVANQNIEAGARLLPSMLRLETRKSDEVGAQVVKDLDEITGTFARLAIASNTPLLKAAMTKTSGAAEITSRIPTGFRAVAIPINALTGVEGWVRPGATVDVVWSVEKKGELAVSTIVENAKVLSVERSLDPEHKGDNGPASVPNHITLLVSSADAQKIQLAKGSGSLNLSLRGAEDSDRVGTAVLTSETLLYKGDPNRDIEAKVVLDGKEFVYHEGGLVLKERYEDDVRARYGR